MCSLEQFESERKLAGTLAAGTNTGAIMFWKYVRDAPVGSDEEAPDAAAAKSGAPPTALPALKEAASASDDLIDHWKAEPSTLLKSSGAMPTAGERPKTSAAGTAGAIGRLEMGSKRELLVAILSRTNEVFVLSEQELNARYRDRVRLTYSCTYSCTYTVYCVFYVCVYCIVRVRVLE